MKFASVATEVRTGHEIWLTHGRIVDASARLLRPAGIFAPVLVGDRWLVDGALVIRCRCRRHGVRRGNRHRSESLERRVQPILRRSIPTVHRRSPSGGGAGSLDRVCLRRRNAASAGCFLPSAVKRSFVGGGGRPRHLHRHVRCFHHARPHQPASAWRGDRPSVDLARVGKSAGSIPPSDDLIRHGARAAEGHRVDPGSDPHSRAGRVTGLVRRS